MTNAAADLRVLKCLDGLHYSFAVLDDVYAPLYQLCTRLPQDSSALIPALWRCWSFVDVVHRIREISQAMPGLSRRSHPLVSFLAETAVVEDCRHYIQHLRSELSQTPPDVFPVWGSLAWVDPSDSSQFHLAVIGVRPPKARYSGCVWDLKEGRWVSRVCLGVQDKSLNFDPIYEATSTFRSFIVPWAQATYKGAVRSVAQLPIMTFRFDLQDRHPEPTRAS